MKRFLIRMNNAPRRLNAQGPVGGGAFTHFERSSKKIYDDLVDVETEERDFGKWGCESDKHF